MIKIDDEKIILTSEVVELSEHQDYKLATFLISVLDEYDLNGRMIPKESGELYHSTIIGFPISAKLVTDYMGNPIDFAGHEATIIKDKNGKKQVKFGTMPIGSVISSYIEERMVDGYEGLKSCIMIQAKLWSTRFPSYFTVLDKLWSENNVKSSWEITVKQSEETTEGKILKSFSFIGNCLLGSKVLGAVPKAGIYEYAELNNETVDISEIELAKALSTDACQKKTLKEQEENNLKSNEQSTIKQSEVVAEASVVEETAVENTEENENNNTTIASLTERDLRNALCKACSDKLNMWCWISFHFPIEKTVWVEAENRKSELDYILFTYECDNDKITVSEPQDVKLSVSISEINSVIAEKDETLVKANEKIQNLSAEISDLKPFKEACEKAERERIEVETAQKKIELKTRIEKSNLFTKEEIQSTEISSLIETVNESAIKKLIVDKFIASLDKTPESTVEVSEVKPTATPRAIIDNSNYSTEFSIAEFMSVYSQK